MSRILSLGAMLLTMVTALMTSLPAWAGTPTFSIAFSPTTIAPGATSTLTYTINNSANNVGISSVAFNNTLPAGMTIKDPNNASTTCSGGTFTATAGSNTINFSDYRIGLGTSCTLSVDVTSSTGGSHTNTTSTLTSSAGSTAAASATLTVDTARPGFSMAFSPSTITPGGVSTLTYTIDNSLNGTNASLLVFTHNLPAGMTVASNPNTSGGTCSALTWAPSPGSSSLSFQGGFPTVNAGSICTVKVDVTVASAGTYHTTTGDLSQNNSNPSGPASAQLNVEVPFMYMTFPNYAAPGASITLSYTMTNADRLNDATGITFSNDLNATLSGLAATALPSTGFCGAGSTISGTSNITVSNASLASGTSCTFSITVLVPSNAAAGSYTNNTSTINLDLGGATTKTAVSNTLTVKKAPRLTMSFIDDPTASGQDVTLRYTLTNTDTANTASAITFTTSLNDSFSGTVIKTLPAANSCGSGSSFTASADSNNNLNFTTTNANLAAGANCTFDVILTIPSDATPGSFVYTSSSVKATISGDTLYGSAATDTLVIVAPPTLQFAITESSATPGATVAAQITMNYSANASADVTGIGFTVDLNSALSGLVATSATQSNVCGSGSSISGTSTLTFSGGSLSPGNSCSFSITLQVPGSAPAGSITVNTSTITGTTASKAVTGAAASDTLLVTGLSLSHQYLTNPILANNTTTIRYTLTNAATAQAATAIAFTHSLTQVISGMAVSGALATTPCGASSTLTGTTTLILSGGELQPGTSCTFDVTVLVPANAADGINSSITSALSATVNASNITADASSASLTVESLSVLLSSTAGSSTSTSPIPLKIDFSRDVTGFALSDLTIANGSGSNFAGSGKSYTVDVTPAADGNVTIDLAAGVVNDQVFPAVTNPAATQLSIAYAASQPVPVPSLVISSPSASKANSGPISYTITYTNAETVGLTSSHITLNKTGTANASVAVTNGTTTTPTVTLSSISGDGTLGISLAANTARNNTQTAPAAGPSSTFTVDNTAPSITISNGSVTTTNAPFTATFTFSEAVSNFAVGDISVTNAVLSSFTTVSSSVYTAVVTPSAQGNVTLSVAANSAQDATGNNNTVSNQLTVLYDSIAPTLSITGPKAPTNTAFTATFTFSEDVSGFTQADIVVANGVLSNFSATSAKVYTTTVTPSAQGNVTLDVAANVANDASGNNNSAASQYSVEYDSVKPTVVISGGANPTNAAFTATITFNEDVNGFTQSDLSVSNAVLSNFSATSAKVYTVTVTPSADGTVTIDLAADTANDNATNGNAAATQYSTVYDGTKPTVVISSPASVVNAAFVATFTFSEAVNGFSSADIAATNAAISNFAATSSSVYTATVTPTTEGNVLLDIASGAAQDNAGNNNDAASQYTVKYDITAPTLTISGPQVATNAAFTATFTFSEDVTGFDASDINTANAVLTNFAATSAKVYTATVTPSSQGTVTLDVAANRAIDSAGNNNTAATQYAVTYDTVNPTLAISSTTNSPTNTAFAVTFTFSEEVSGFTVNDVQVGNGTATNFVTTSASVYSATITPSAEGNVTVNVNASAAADKAGNLNTAATPFSMTYDTTGPTVTIIGPNTPSNVAYTLTINFSEDVSGFIQSDINVSNGVLSNFASNSSSSYSVLVTPSAQGDVSVNVPASAALDLAGNANTASNNHVITYDTIAPTVVITGPTTPSNSAFTATVTFSEDVTGFAQSDIIVSNASLSSFSATSAKVYTVLVTPTAQNTVSLNIPTAAAIDSANNGNSAANEFSVVYDSVAPTVTISGPRVPQNSGFSATFTFSEDVTGFTASDIVVGNAVLSNFATTSAKVYTATITPSSQGSVTLDIAAAVAQDSAGNNNDAATQYTVDYDSVAPSLVISGPAGPVSTTFTATFTFSEEVSGFTQGDIQLSNASIANFATSDNKIFTASITPINSGALTLNVAAATAQDLAGNNNLAASEYSITYDNVRPGIKLTSPSSSVNAPFTTTMTFTKAVNNFDTSKITVTNAALSNFDSSSAPVYTVLVTPTAAGQVSLVINEGVVSDAANNTNTASNTLNVQYDTSVPTLVSLSPANGSVDVATKPELVLTFSESMLAGSSNNLISVKQLSDNSVFEAVAANTQAVTIDGSTVKVALSKTMAEYTQYYVTVDAGAFTDLASNAYAGFNNNTTWQFKVINLPPVTVADAVVVDEDNSAKIDILANDSGNNSDINPASVLFSSLPTSGKVQLNSATGLVTYTPTANFYGNDSFSYTVSDMIGDRSAQTSVKITVNATNDAPVANHDVATTAQNNALTINVLSNDSDPDGSLNSAGLRIVSRPHNGWVEVIGGQARYTPNTNYQGTDSFEYVAIDNAGLTSNAATVYVNVSGNNIPPTANADSTSTTEDNSVSIDILSNDSDSDGSLDTSAVIVLTAPGNGTATVQSGGTILYTPASNYNGSDSFSYIVKDNLGAYSNLATVSVSISAVNDAPEALNDVLVLLNTIDTHSLNILGNDFDVDGSITTVNIITQPTQGSLSLDSETFLVSYTPNADYSGTDSFTYQVQDNNGATSATATVSIGRNAPNEAPLANDDHAQTQEDKFIAIAVLSNDSDSDGVIDRSSLTITSNPTNGSVTVNRAGGVVFYTPNSNFSGNDSFVYRVADNNGATATATAHIRVIAVNDAPVAASQNVQVNEDSSVSFSLTATDAENDGLNYFLDRYPSNGTLSGTVPNLTYTPQANFNGADSLTFYVDDGNSQSASATITLTVNGVNDQPQANSQQVQLLEDTSIAIFLSGSDIDNDALTYVITSAPANGILTGSGNSRVYAPSANFSGSDSFKFVVNDGTQNSPEATVSITVTGFNDAPIAASQTVTTNEDNSVAITLSAVDPEGATINYILTSNPRNGTLSGSAPNLNYTPNSNFEGTDNFTFTASDASLTSATATVTINVNAVNDSPTVRTLNVTANEDVPLSITLVGSDIDNTNLSYRVTSEPTQGTLSGNAPNLVYSPNANFNGSDSFAYVANDGNVDSAAATVNITINPINDAPTAVNDAVSHSGWTPFDINVLSNDSDADGDTITITGVTATSGTATTDGNTVNYTPVNGFIGATALSYTIADGNGGVASAIVQLTISADGGNNRALVSVPADIEVMATGLLTKVDLGVATAIDAQGNPLAVTMLNDSNYFKPGVNTVYWQATDAQGNTTVASQQVLVHPKVSIASDQVAVEGFTATITVHLNGQSPVYPVTVPYSVEGSAVYGEDHDLTDGVLSIESGTEGRIVVNLYQDNYLDDLETLTVKLDDALNLGAQRNHTLSLSESNLPPMLSFKVKQDERENISVYKDGGLVNIDALAAHADPSKQYRYQWSTEEEALQQYMGTEPGLSFPLDELAPGNYSLNVTVTDTDYDWVSLNKTLNFTVAQSVAQLDQSDSDGDGINDRLEGLNDSDGDGIADYLDAINSCDVLQSARLEAKRFLIEGAAGNCLSLGQTALKTAQAAALVQDDDTTDGWLDLVIEHLAISGQSSYVIMPQQRPLADNASFQIKSSQDQWFEFVSDSNNYLVSAQGDAGFCPAAGSNTWQRGLKAGHWCVMMVISDGGPNDIDGQADNRIVVRAGLRAALQNNRPSAIDDSVQARAGVAQVIDALSNDSDSDGDSLTISSATALFGQVSIVANQLHYQPPATLFGQDTITYGISDNNGGTSFAKVALAVSMNRAPVVNDDSASVTGGQEVQINVLANDSDADGDMLTIDSVSAERGSISVNQAQQLVYRADNDFAGQVVIQYSVNDGFGGQASAQVLVTVNRASQPQSQSSADSANTSSGGGTMYWLWLMLGAIGIARANSRKH